MLLIEVAADAPTPATAAAPAPTTSGCSVRTSTPRSSPWIRGARAAAPEVDGTADSDRRFDYVLTYDRPQVTALAAALMSRVRPQGLPQQGLPR